MAKYRTARGATVDLSQVLAENEDTRTVGNMNTNARGDVIDSKNKVVESRNARVKKQYSKQHKTVVTDDIVPTSKRQAQKIKDTQAQLEASKTNADRIAEEYVQPATTVVKQPDPEPVVEEAIAPNPVVDPAVQAMQEKAPTPKAESTPKGGLAAAIAKARESKQEMLKTPRQEARDSSGVKRF